MKRALLIVDAQNDFLPGGPLAVPEGDMVIDTILGLLKEPERYHLIAVSQDWHPPEHGSFAASHPGATPFSMGTLAGRAQMLWPEHCIAESDGARLAPALRERLVTIAEDGHKTVIITKGLDTEVDSYSAFFDNAGINETGLDRALRAHDIEALDVVGLALDYCVKFSALDGAALGYQTRVLLAATKAVVPQNADAVITELRGAGVVCIEDDSTEASLRTA
jgi:nicotinamidase/pyrazinamidase